jgi:uncharacterized protein (TIGR03435 family)
MNLITFAFLVLPIAARGIEAQPVDARLSFEVSSVKSDKSETGVDRVKIAEGSLIIQNVSLKRCIGLAYGRDYLLSGPDWLDSERFDISAKFPPETLDHDVLLMLQGLLAERFNLALHRETRQFSAYALVIGKGGPKLHAAAAPDGEYMFRAQAGRATGSSISMHAFADRLSRSVFQLDRQVVDFTGLTGTFDLTLDWNPNNTQSDATGPSIFTAVQEQFGLKLEPRKVPLEVLIVDHVNRVPTAN